MTGRTVVLAGALTLALAGVAAGAVLTVDADDMTLVRIPGSIAPKTCTVTAVADAHVDEAQPDANAGTAATVAVAAGPSDQRAFVRFDVGSCSIPTAAEVRSAALSMVLTTAPATDRSWEVRRVGGAWTETGITWNTQPLLAAASTHAVATRTAAGVTLTWNVLADVADVVSGAVADNGWRIADADETATTAVGGALASREASAGKPSLTVTWFD